MIVKPDLQIIKATDKDWLSHDKVINYHQLANFLVLWAPRFFKNQHAAKITVFADTWEPRFHRLIEEVITQALPPSFECEAGASFVQKTDYLKPVSGYVIYLGIPPGPEHLRHAMEQAAKTVIITYRGDLTRLHEMIQFNFKGFNRDLVMVNNIWNGNDPVKNISESYGLAGYFQFLDYNVSYTFMLERKRNNKELIEKITGLFLDGETLLCRLKILLQSGGELDISLDTRMFRQAISNAARSCKTDEDFLAELNRCYTDLQRDKDHQAQVFYHDYLISFQYPPSRHKREAIRNLIHSLRWEEDTERLLFILQRMGMIDEAVKEDDGRYQVKFTKRHNHYYVNRLTGLAYELLPPQQAKWHLRKYQIDEESLLAEQFFECFIELLYHIEVPHFTKRVTECRDWVYQVMNHPDKPSLAQLKVVLSQNYVPLLRELIVQSASVNKSMAIMEQLIVKLQGEKHYTNSLSHMINSLKSITGLSKEEPVVFIFRGLCELSASVSPLSSNLKIVDQAMYSRAKKMLLEGVEQLIRAETLHPVDVLNRLAELEHSVDFFGEHISAAWKAVISLVYWRHVQQTSVDLMVKFNPGRYAESV